MKAYHSPTMKEAWSQPCVCGHRSKDVVKGLAHLDKCPAMGKARLQYRRNKLGGLVAPLPRKPVHEEKGI